MSSCIRRVLTTFAWVWIGALVVPLLAVNAADAPPDDFYVLKGDYGEITAKGAIRFLVHGAADYLPRSGDPRAAERELAEKLANRLGLKAVFISVTLPRRWDSIRAGGSAMWKRRCYC